MRKVYADSSATSFPKAPGMSDAVRDYLDHGSYNVNRGGYAGAYDVAMHILETRQALADLFHVPDARHVAFTPGLTWSLNMLLAGYLKQGDHVIVSSMEHNAVMRPLYALSKKGVACDVAPCAADGSLDPAVILPLIRKETRAVVMTHASNVCGTVLPVGDVSALCAKHGLRLIVDAAQTAGVLDIDAGAADALVFSGHKGLLGPQGIGGFVVKADFADEIAPLVTGGTGSLSDDPEQPAFLPDKFEPGTMNIPGILGLQKALAYIRETGIQTIYDKEMRLTSAFLEKLRGIAGVRLIGREGIDGRIAVVSLDFPGLDNAAVAEALDSDYGIMTRCGLHCAPSAHRTLHTWPQGTVRFSFGHFLTTDDVEYIAQAIKEIVKKGDHHGL